MTFEDDKLGLKEFAERLERFLIVEHDFVDGSLVVSLNAPFGSGKSTFLSMWKADLDKRKQKQESNILTISLNAWESDYCGDPLLAVLSGLIKAVEQNEPKKTEDVVELREAVKDVAWFGLGLVNNFVSKTGFDPIAAGEFAQAKREEREERRPDFIELYESKAKALKRLKGSLAAVFGGNDVKAVIFVDELDRCRPDYAVSYLETIKHVFDVHGLVFVLAVDYHQLSCSARALFGADLNFPEYLRKFIHRTIALQVPTVKNLSKLTDHYCDFYLEKTGRRYSRLKIDTAKEDTRLLISALKLTPRQAQEAFRIVGHVLSGEESQRGGIYPAHGSIVLLMAALKVSNRSEYLQIGTGVADLVKMGEFFKDLFQPNHRVFQWWFGIYLAASFENDEIPVLKVEKALKDNGYIAKDIQLDVHVHVREYARLLGGYPGKWLVRAYQHIEAIMPYE